MIDPIDEIAQLPSRLASNKIVKTIAVDRKRSADVGSHDLTMPLGLNDISLRTERQLSLDMNRKPDGLQPAQQRTWAPPSTQ